MASCTDSKATTDHDTRISPVETFMAEGLCKLQGGLALAETIIVEIAAGRTGRPEAVANIVLFHNAHCASYMFGASINNIHRAASA